MTDHRARGEQDDAGPLGEVGPGRPDDRTPPVTASGWSRASEEAERSWEHGASSVTGQGTDEPVGPGRLQGSNSSAVPGGPWGVDGAGSGAQGVDVPATSGGSGSWGTEGAATAAWGTGGASSAVLGVDPTRTRQTSHHVESRGRTASTRVLILVGLVCALLAGTVAGIIGHNAGVAAADRRHEPVVAELAELQSEQEAARAAAAEVPNLEEVADRVLADSGLLWFGSSDSLTVTMEYRGGAELRDLLDELGFSSAVLDRMGKTRALDGTQSAEGLNCNVTWTYHPDDGLQLVFETD